MNYSIGRGKMILGSYSQEQIVSMSNSGALKHTDVWYNTSTEAWCALPALVDWLKTQPPPPPVPVFHPARPQVKTKSERSVVKSIALSILVLISFLFIVGAVGTAFSTPTPPAPAEDKTPELLKKYATECGDNTELKSVADQMVLANMPDRLIDHVISCVNTHKVCIGMPERALKLSWGEPDHVNSTTTSFGTTKQLVYDSQYVYIDADGLVTSWQGN